MNTTKGKTMTPYSKPASEAFVSEVAEAIAKAKARKVSEQNEWNARHLAPRPTYLPPDVPMTGTVEPRPTRCVHGDIRLCDYCWE